MRNIANYKPIQPDFKMKSCYHNKMKDRFYFYQFRSNEKEANAIVIPDGCIDILVKCDYFSPNGNICGSVLQSKELQLQPDVDYFGVRFLPGDNSLVREFTMREIINHEIPLKYVFKGMPDIVEQISGAKDFHKRVSLVSEILNHDSTGNTHDILKYSLSYIYQSRGSVTSNQLADKTGYSTRYLRKIFEEKMGISPKLFSQIVRFQYSLAMLMQNGADSLWKVIVENGYHDQAHFIREFKKFNYITPGQFVEKVFGRNID